MSKKLFLLSLVLVLCGLAMAASKPMSDQQLATVTAGSGFGASAIALPGSKVTVDTEATVTLSGQALQDAKSVNLVNTTNGALALGVNIWDGKITRDVDDKSFGGSYSKGVEQFNYLTNVLPAASGAFVTGYSSAGSLKLINPSLKVSAETLRVDVGFVHESSFEVSNTFDQFLGLAAAGTLSVTPSPLTVDASGAICVICNTFDQFEAEANDFTAAFAALREAKLNVEAKADEVAIRGPVSIADAYAQYIAGEDATLNAKDINNLTLSDNALRGASAVNIVNSVNGLVGVGVNVATAYYGLSKQANIINNGAQVVSVAGH